MLKPINKVIKVLILSDFFINSAWGLLSPIFAIFILQDIVSGNLAKAAEVAGFASLSYWGVKSVLQIPIGRYLDRNHGELDDFWFMFIGTLLTALVPLGYLISYLPWHIYFFQVIHAIGMSMLIPSWYAIFTRHIDKTKEAFEWGFDSTVLGIGTGITGAIGGVMAAVFNFNIIFMITSVLNIVSAITLLLIKKDISLKDNIPHQIPPTRSL